MLASSRLDDCPPMAMDMAWPRPVPSELRHEMVERSGSAGADVTWHVYPVNRRSSAGCQGPYSTPSMVATG
jgi:hypothetical protein